MIELLGKPQILGLSWYEVCMVVPETDGDTENGSCEPTWWKNMMLSVSESEAIKIANEKAVEDWKSPMVDASGIEIRPSDKDMGLKCPICEWAKKVTEEEYQDWKASRERLEVSL